ncbi:TonB-dependent receptor [Hoylesella saccharolytica F0055]|jgi:hypothetical protein|uniref:TonB-dependent receptor n=1 Tax=Hoylesella saccharolytica F0055 TaxID=1127699 RepID=L1N1H7_9BACT|nr:TonB-dependent receptor [Hoylesella saccharolytica]EKX97333.1 TonB-dependent receptor [Hoylesella saccharolytica F0055]
MLTKLKMAVVALCYSSLSFAQNVNDTITQQATGVDESAFTFTEAQLGENENTVQNITIINSGTNLYASQVGFQFSPMRFRYRGLSQKYNEVYVNGILMNDVENGQFRFSQVGGLNQQTKNADFALPFEANGFAMPGLAGSNNYDFRPANQPAGHRITLGGANRNYTLRGMYTFSSGLNKHGWAFSGNLTYRWASEGYVEGTFYNALSYFLGVQKIFGENGKHSLSFSTWGNPTERATQGAATDESYWIANDRYYNPYWGYQNGKKRNSRIVNDFAPSAVLTWDWKIDENTKLNTSLFGRYSMYKSTKLNYNNSDNPQPDYWKLLPSSYYDVWDETNTVARTSQSLIDWGMAYDYLTASKANRQINWDRLYMANRNVSAQGADAMYFIQARRNDALTLSLASTLNMQLDKKSNWNLGYLLSTNNARHYQTMEDLLGATSYHNINTYAVGTYAPSSDQVQYDLNRRNATVGKGDVFGYDYHLLVNKASVWTNYNRLVGRFNLMAAAKVGGVSMQRDGKMRNGLFANNSYGKSGTANFFEGGVKASAIFSAGHGHTFSLGAGYQYNAPTAYVAFSAPEMNNDFARNLKNERVFSTDLGYQYQSSKLHINLNAYYNHADQVTDWQCFYFDDINSFSYVSITDGKKAYYGIETAAKYRINSSFDIKLLGTISEAKSINDARVNYLNSTQGVYESDILLNKNMHESGTPLTAASLILSYHKGGWFVDLSGNYYDRIYLSPSLYYRYKSIGEKRGNIDENGNVKRIPQEQGNGGFMLSGSIGKNIYLKHGSLSINLMVDNILNNKNLVTGGYEQSRSDFTASGNARAYKFSRNPKKYYAYGANGLLNITYKF